MMKREFDGQCWCPQLGELPGSVSSVVPVKEHSFRKWKPEKNHDRCDGSTDHPETGVALSDVVHQRRCDDRSIVVPIRDDTQSGVIAVTLVRVHLLEEHLSHLRGEPRVNSGPLGDRQRLRCEDVEEPSDQVAQRAPSQEFAWDLQSTQSTDAGRNFIRSAPISLPQLSQVP